MRQFAVTGPKYHTCLGGFLGASGGKRAYLARFWLLHIVPKVAERNRNRDASNKIKYNMRW